MEKEEKEGKEFLVLYFVFWRRQMSNLLLYYDYVWKFFNLSIFLNENLREKL